VGRSVNELDNSLRIFERLTVEVFSAHGIGVGTSANMAAMEAMYDRVIDSKTWRIDWI
jgi:hypothetical protein